MRLSRLSLALSIDEKNIFLSGLNAMNGGTGGTVTFSRYSLEVLCVEQNFLRLFMFSINVFSILRFIVFVPKHNLVKSHN